MRVTTTGNATTREPTTLAGCRWVLVSKGQVKKNVKWGWALRLFPETVEADERQVWTATEWANVRDVVCSGRWCGPWFLAAGWWLRRSKQAITRQRESEHQGPRLRPPGTYEVYTIPIFRQASLAELTLAHWDGAALLSPYLPALAHLHASNYPFKRIDANIPLFFSLKRYTISLHFQATVMKRPINISELYFIKVLYRT